tara:strand:- start:103 stop:339 length:237 start_codon:yes stop_codon:yes gene_type:complete
MATNDLFSDAITYTVLAWLCLNKKALLIYSKVMAYHCFSTSIINLTNFASSINGIDSSRADRTLQPRSLHQNGSGTRN